MNVSNDFGQAVFDVALLKTNKKPLSINLNMLPLFFGLILSVCFGVDFVVVAASHRPNALILLTDDQDVVLGGFKHMAQVQKHLVEVRHGIFLVPNDS